VSEQSDPNSKQLLNSGFQKRIMYSQVEERKMIIVLLFFLYELFKAVGISTRIITLPVICAGIFYVIVAITCFVVHIVWWDGDES